MKLTKNLTYVICVLLILIAIACGALLVIKLNDNVTVAESIVASSCVNLGIISKLF